MSLLWIDGFDHYAGPSPTDPAQKYSTITGTPTISTATGVRTGRAAMVLGSGVGVQKTFTANVHASWCVGVAVYMTTFAATNNLISITDAGTVQVHAQVDVTTGRISVYRGSGTSNLLGTTDAGHPMQVNVSSYIDLVVTIHATLGTVTLYMDGIARLTLTAQNTQTTANATADGFQLNSSSSGGPQAYFDDLYCTNGAGASPWNGRLANVRVETLTVTANGSSNNDWTASAGVRSDCVDETTPNGDTDYVSDNTAGHVQMFAMSNLSAPTLTVYGVQVTGSGKTDAANTVKSEVRSNSTNYPATAAQALTASYVMYTDLWQTDPYTGSPWPVATVNAIEAGWKLET